MIFLEVIMNSKEYVENALKTEAVNFNAIVQRMGSPENIRLLHAAIGLATESGEIQDQLKKAIFYGKPLDKVNLEEELGDLFWYIALMSDALNVSFEDIMAKNVAKLKARYGDKFSESAALDRNLSVEREILEKK
jgi:NTP pyrophosphatase (non-canonical NTP hydrolase)